MFYQVSITTTGYFVMTSVFVFDLNESSVQIKPWRLPRFF